LVGKQEVHAAVVGLLVGVSVVVFASAWGERAPRDEVTVSEENVESTQKRPRPAWLTDYSLHMNLIGVLGSLSGSPPSEEAEPVERSELDALMDSLSPGVRASYEGWLLEREHARTSERENAKTREHLREEAEYRAFIEARLRRLRGERASGK
jgi:hypothetical protein